MWHLPCLPSCLLLSIYIHVFATYFYKEKICANPIFCPVSVKWIIKQLNRSWPGVINPRRPRGSQSGWEERRESKLPLQVRRFSLFSQCGPPALREPFCPFQKFIKCPTTCGSHPPSWNENGTTYMIHDMLPARPVRAYLLSPTADFFDGGSHARENNGLKN